jgi:hypothetical protein
MDGLQRPLLACQIDETTKDNPETVASRRAEDADVAE